MNAVLFFFFCKTLHSRMEFFLQLFEDDFMPHGHCYYWQPEILWSHVIGDGLTALAYFLIPAILIRFIRLRKDISFHYIFLAFALFIISCGISHLVSIVTIWVPYYRLEAVSKLFTAFVSFGTVILLMKNFSKLLQLPSPRALKVLNAELLKEAEDRKIQEAYLRQSEEKFRLGMQHAPIGIALVALDGSWMEVNDATCKMLGYTREELLQTNFQNLTHPDSLDEDLDNVQKVLRGEIGSYRMEKRYIHKEGHEIWGLLSVSLVRDQNDSPLHFISQIVDIQKIKEAELQMLHFNQELEEKVRARTVELEELNVEMENFVYTITHDLRLPVKNLIGLLDLFSMDYKQKVDDDGQVILKMLKNNIRKLDVLITDLLTFCRIKHLDLVKKPFDIQKIMLEISSELRESFTQNTMECKITELPHAYGDENSLRQVCFNLLSNALKYSSKEEHAKVEIGGRKEGNENIYWVKDNGVGFDSKQSEKLFTIFQRLHSPKEFEGTGVGLAMSKQILTKHGGRIWAEAEVGKGATFYFSLPRPPHSPGESLTG